MGVSYRHLAGVLLGERDSKSLLFRISMIPHRENIPHNSPYKREATHA